MTIIIPRSVWGPRYPNGCEVIGTQEWLNAGKELWLHHSTTHPFGPDATLEQDCQHMRDFEAIGQSRFGCGISYTWVVMPSRRVFQGHDLDRQGTHTYGHNNSGRAICLAGDYQTNDLPQGMQDSVALLLRELDATLDGGHRDVYPTDCPGDRAYACIGAMNGLATSGVPIGEENPHQSGEDVMFLRIIEGSNTGYTFMVSGGIVTGLDAKTSKAVDETDRKSPGTLTGVTQAVFDDLVRKSKAQESIPAKLDKLAELLTPKS